MSITFKRPIGSALHPENDYDKPKEIRLYDPDFLSHSVLPSASSSLLQADQMQET
jgi:hypothetical protein